MFALQHPRAAALFVSLWFGVAAGQTISTSPPSPARAVPLEAVVNGVKSGTWLFIEREGTLHAPRNAFEEWRVPLPTDAQALVFQGEPYWSLSAVPGFTVKRNDANQSLDIGFSPDNFPTTRLTSNLGKRPALSPVLTSLFFNYDLAYTAATQSNAPNSTDLGLLGELGISTAVGVLTSSAAGRNLSDSTTSGTPRQWRRLETTFTKDFPEQNHTLRLGDSTTRGGTLGRNVYFGGIQYGSNYALTPGFWAQPLPVLSGLSAAPSTVDLYVDNVLRQTSNVPTGPFVVDNFPSLTGSGQIRMVVRDILGRETVINQPFFTHDRLLKAGLNDWSVEAGRLRRDLGLASNLYGPLFASGLWRRGITPAMTLEGRAEATADLRSLGLGLALALPGQILGRAAVTTSHERSLGSASQWLLGLDSQSQRMNAQFEVQGASANFRQLGLEAATLPTRRQFAGSWNYRLAQETSSVGVSFVEVHRFDAPRISTLSLNFAMRVGALSTLNVTASRSRAESSTSTLGISLIVPFERSRLVTASAQRSSGRTDAYVSAEQILGLEEGLGWRMLAGHQPDHSRAEGGVSYLGRYGQASGDIRTTAGQSALRLGARGALVAADGNVFVTRYLNQSFAVAEVAGFSDIGIGLGSNIISRTNASGVALVPQLAAYQLNSVRLDAAGLPLNAEIDSIERSAVPSWRSAVKVVFPVRSGRSALIKIALDDQQPAPTGAIIRIEGDTQEFVVARRGEAFVTGLTATSRLQLTWKGQSCQFELVLPPENPDDITRLGLLICKGVVR